MVSAKLKEAKIKKKYEKEEYNILYGFKNTNLSKLFYLYFILFILD
jgi:hypothetical protein